MPGTIWTKVELNEIVAQLNSGYATVGQISRARGVSEQGLYRLLYRRGLIQKSSRRCWAATLHLPRDPGLIGYIAGLIDGEGSVTSDRPYHHWEVKITMTDREVIDWLESLGGAVLVRRSVVPNRKPSWTWSVARKRDVAMLLRATLPYLRVPAKKERANMATRDLADFLVPRATAG